MPEILTERERREMLRRFRHGKCPWRTCGQRWCWYCIRRTVTGANRREKARFLRRVKALEGMIPVVRMRRNPATGRWEREGS